MHKTPDIQSPAAHEVAPRIARHAVINAGLCDLTGLNISASSFCKEVAHV
ncbi:MAG: hypothetical protein WBC93_00405 [Sulfitobacter sp.]